MLRPAKDKKKAKITKGTLITPIIMQLLAEI